MTSPNVCCSGSGQTVLEGGVFLANLPKALPCLEIPARQNRQGKEGIAA